MRNYLETENPFNLAKPPESFLRDLFAYDDKIVIFPSKKEPVYRFCRRASGNTFWQRFDRSHPDSAICLTFRLIPLKAILPSPTWGQTLISQIAACDIQRVGGGQAASELLEQQEELEERRQLVSQNDECDARSAEAYKGLKAQLGERIHLGTRTRDGAGATKNPLSQRLASKRTYRPRGSGDHAMFVGR
jgi:hypothetical protein